MSGNKKQSLQQIHAKFCGIRKEELCFIFCCCQGLKVFKICGGLKAIPICSIDGMFLVWREKFSAPSSNKNLK
jgi:hypothetical protein